MQGYLQQRTQGAGDDKSLEPGIPVIRAAMFSSRTITRRRQALSERCPHLVDAVNRLIRATHSSGTIELSFHHDVPRGVLTHLEFRTALRIIQECVSGVTRLCRSARLRIEAIAAKDVLRVRVEDDEFAVPRANVDFGRLAIDEMRRCIEVLEGRFTLGNRLGGGSFVRAEIPLPRRAPAR